MERKVYFSYDGKAETFDKKSTITRKPYNSVEKPHFLLLKNKHVLTSIQEKV